MPWSGLDIKYNSKIAWNFQKYGKVWSSRLDNFILFIFKECRCNKKKRITKVAWINHIKASWMTSLTLARKITKRIVTGGFGEEISTIIGNFFMTRHILVLCMSQQDSLNTKQLVGIVGIFETLIHLLW